MSLTYHQHLVDAGIVESTGSVGDSYDNALAENVNGSYKNEIIHTRRWADVLEVEIATFEWVNWWNTERLHQALDHRTPAEVETDYWQQHQLSATTTNRVNAQEANPDHFSAVSSLAGTAWEQPCQRAPVATNGRKPAAQRPARSRASLATWTNAAGS